MKTIFKYPLELTDRQEVNMPFDAKILTVQVQYGVPCIWAIVDTEIKHFHSRVFDIVGTGNPMRDCNHKYLGTIQLHDGALVFHVFEVI